MKNWKKIIISILIFCVCALAFYIAIETLCAKNEGRQPRIFGYTFHVVVTDSMEPDINRGDFIAASYADKESVKAGDYIVFVSPDPDLKGKTIVHMVSGVFSEDGEIYFNTTGIKQGASPDDYPVRDIIGKYRFKSAFLGRVFAALSKIENLLFLSLIIYILYICVRQVIKIARIKKQLKQNKN